MKGYLDRIEEEKFAVILVEDMNKEFIIPKTELPKESTPGCWFDLTIKDGKITSMSKDEETTFSKLQKTENLMSKLQAKKKGSKFKKK